MKSTRKLSLTLALALTAAVPTQAADYKLDPIHSTAMFGARHFGVSNVYGRFTDISGTISYDESNAAASRVELEIKTASVDTANEQRDNHLRSPDFFNAKQFPVMTFESKSIRKVGDDLYEVTGDLTLLGVTKSITAEVELVGTGKHPRGGHPLIGFETRMTLKRSDFGMSFMVGPVGDEIRVLVAVEAGATS